MSQTPHSLKITRDTSPLSLNQVRCVNLNLGVDNLFQSPLPPSIPLRSFKKDQWKATIRSHLPEPVVLPLRTEMTPIGPLRSPLLSVVKGRVGVLKKRHRSESISQSASVPAPKKVGMDIFRESKVNVSVSSKKASSGQAASTASGAQVKVNPSKIRVKTVKVAPPQPSAPTVAVKQSGSLPPAFATASDVPFVPLRLSERAEAQVRESCAVVRGQIDPIQSSAPFESEIVRAS